MAAVNWTTRAYNIAGTGLLANYAVYDNIPGDSNTNAVRHARSRQLVYNLNGIDQYSFMMHLDDPMALNIHRLKTVIKVFRSVSDTEHGVTVSDSNPCFCGVVGSTIKDGEANTMQVNVYNPFWRLQSRFHLLNHYLEVNPDTGLNYTQSELIWKLIDLVNEAFGSASNTGIDQGTFEWGLPGEPQVAPYFVARGSNTWANIFDDIMMRAASVDLFPVYHHTNGDPIMMHLNTMEKRGLDKSAALHFNYHTDPAVEVPNLDNLIEEETPTPGNNDGGFANYQWTVGQGGPNSGKIGVNQNASAGSGTDGYGEIGVYMARIDRPEIKKITGDGGLQKIGDAEFLQRKIPSKTYVITLNPGMGLYYDYDFVLGDVAELNASRGALIVPSVKQRIYNAQLDLSDNNVETATLLVSKDFYGKVAT